MTDTKQKVYIAATYDSLDYINNLLPYLYGDDEIVSKYDIIDIGANSKHTEKYNMEHFTVFHVAKLIAANVKENEHRGIVISGTGGGANLFDSSAKHIRASMANSPKYAEDLSKKSIVNVLSVSSNYIGALYAVDNVSAFLLAEPEMTGSSLKKAIKMKTHKNDPLRFWLWKYKSKLMSKISR